MFSLQLVSLVSFPWCYSSAGVTGVIPRCYSSAGVTGVIPRSSSSVITGLGGGGVISEDLDR